MSDPKKQSMCLIGATFRDSVAFGAQSMSVQVGRNCDSIFAARLEADGYPVAIDKGQRADGIALHRKATQTKPEQLSFVPWANVGELQYGETSKK